MSLVVLWLILFVSVVVFVNQYFRYLNMLIVLEVLVGVVYIWFVVWFSSWGVDSSFALVLMTFAACEASLGLSLLVTLIRQVGNDYVKLGVFLC